MGSYAYRAYPYRRPPELDGTATRRGVTIVGAGLAGPTLALLLARHGVPSLLLDEDDTVSVGSRSICQAKHTLEVWDQIGVAAPVVAKGVTWDQGEVLLGERPIYRFHLQPEPGHKFPAFVNLQQYYVEEYLYARCLAEPLIELRPRHKVVGIDNGAEGVTLSVEPPEPTVPIVSDWVVACDGVRSAIRRLLDLPFPGEVFDDRFLIADIRLRAELPAERRFWFYPPFHPTNSVLMHRQADDVLRVDFQLGRDADPVEEAKPENVDRRLRGMFGPDAEWEHEWTSVYTFTCRSLDRFVHGRTIFAGDSAHVVSPFGARGGNSGVDDVDNLAWKLARVVRGESFQALLDSYDIERRAAARENIRQSTRSTDFITPKFAASRVFRDATLALARDYPFARAFLNSGRLSVATAAPGSPLSTPDIDADWTGGPAPGEPMIDAPHTNRWLIDQVGKGFALLAFDADGLRPPRDVTVVALSASGVAARRYGAAPGTVYLIRPDRYVAARWRQPNDAVIEKAWRRACGEGRAS